MLKAAQAALADKGRCDVALRGVSVGAGYVMWNVPVSQCLQELSDAVVLATYQFAKPNQKAPAWVYSLPEPARKAKLAMVKKYGSPNVFSQFDPHLTIAYDTADNLTAIFGGLETAAQFAAAQVGVSRVGPFGTVLKHGQLSNFSIGGSRVVAAPLSASQDYCRPSDSTNWDYFLLVREWPGTMTPGPLPSYIDTFTLHGLWPNRNDGSWPQCCNNRCVLVFFVSL